MEKAIKDSPNKKSCGSDGVTSLHMKRLGDKAKQLLAQLYTQSVNKNIIPQTWNTAKIIPITKPNKDKELGSSYRPISLLSYIVKTLERILLRKITSYLPNESYQHGCDTPAHD